MRKLFVYVLVLLHVCLAACNTATDLIPETYVNLQLPVDYYPELNAVGNAVMLDGGVKGVIVYRKSLDEFQAFERACPYNPFDHGSAVVFADDFSKVVADTVCGSEFDLWINGAVIKQPAMQGLKQYNVYYDSNVRIVYVSNL